MTAEQLTIPQALQAAKQAGFSAVSAPFIVAIALAETGGTLQTHPQDNINLDPSLMGTAYYGSRDRGILQINNVAHPEVSDSCAYDPVCAFAAAFKISSGGTNFGQWSTTNTNPATGQPYYQPYLAQTQAAAIGLPFSDVPPLSPNATPTDAPGGVLDPINWFTGSAQNDITNTIVKDTFKALGGFFTQLWNKIAKPLENIALRGGEIWLGGVLVIVGAFVVFTGTSTGKEITASAAKAAVAE